MANAPQRRLCREFCCHRGDTGTRDCARVLGARQVSVCVPLHGVGCGTGATAVPRLLPCRRRRHRTASSPPASSTATARGASGRKHVRRRLLGELQGTAAPGRLVRRRGRRDERRPLLETAPPAWASPSTNQCHPPPASRPPLVRLSHRQHHAATKVLRVNVHSPLLREKPEAHRVRPRPHLRPLGPWHHPCQLPRHRSRRRSV